MADTEHYVREDVRGFLTMLEQMGGLPGIVASTIPVVVFVIANLLLELRLAVIAALVSGVAIAGWRIMRRQPLQPAVSGLFGVGIAAFLYEMRDGAWAASALIGVLVGAVWNYALSSKFTWGRY